MTRIRMVALLVATTVVAVAMPAAEVSAKQPIVKKVRVLDDFFSPAKVTIKRGTEINWVWSSSNFAAHNVVLAVGPRGVNKGKFKSRTAARGVKFERVFTTVGTYDFVCTVHPGMDMAVVVKR